ncbi:MAG: VWA domain-containing protein [Bryobacterales bacterium]|nr:VWA domain-containing protein [Bryobacterales bacterium]
MLCAVLLLLLPSIIFASAPLPQQPAQQQPHEQPQQETPVFRTGVSLVRVDAQVVSDRRPVQGLTRQDFIVLDNGDPQPIEYFGRESEPIWLVLLLDVSGSMTRRVSEIAAVARQSLKTLKPEDQVAVMLFSRNTKLAADFSANPEDAAPAIQQAARERSLGAGSRIYESIVDAANYIKLKAANKPGRRAIVILTDNEGLAYQVPDQIVLNALFAANTTLNAIVTPNAKPPAALKPGQQFNPDFIPHDVFKLARETGGEVLKAQNAGETFNDMLDRLRTRYSLHYRPPQQTKPGAIHTIKVALSPEAARRYPKAEVRARSGYVVDQ